MVMGVITGVFVVGLGGYVVARDLGPDTTPAPDLARKPVAAAANEPDIDDREDPAPRAGRANRTPRTKSAAAQRQEYEEAVEAEMGNIPITVYMTDW